MSSTIARGVAYENKVKKILLNDNIENYPIRWDISLSNTELYIFEVTLPLG